MEVQFNTDNQISGTENVADRVETDLRHRLARFEERLTRIEVHIGDTNGPTGGNDMRCTIEARPRGGEPVAVTAQAAQLDIAARQAGDKMVSLLDSHFGKADRKVR